MDFWIVFLCALGVTAALTPLAIKVAHKTGALDIPKDNRRVHQRPVPRIGGSAIFFGTMLSILLAMAMDLLGTPDTEMKITGILVGGAFVYILGTIDDFRNLPALVKLFGQIGCAVVVFAFGNRIDFITNYLGEGTQHLAWAVSLLVTVVWIVAITNTINLVDGLDGLATGISAIASLCIAYVAYIFGYYPTCLCLLAVAGSSLGFLPFNFYPAKTFMGDGGALFLGFMIANLSILEPVKRATIVAVLIPVLVLALPLFDTAWAIIRRKVNKKPIMEADKGHIHHRLMRTGMGQRRTVLCLYGICGIMGVDAVLMSRALYVECLGLLAVAGTFLLVVMTDMNDIRPRLRKESDNKTHKDQEKRT